jgi:mRNA interferase MazF
MTRGALVTVALSGDFGKPRPALVIQSDIFNQTATLTMLMLTTSIADIPLLRVIVEPNEANGLRARSQIQIDKMVTTWRSKVGNSFGRVGPEVLAEVERRLAVFLGLSK